jgi:hypothetical protein
MRAPAPRAAAAAGRPRAPRCRVARRRPTARAPAAAAASPASPDSGWATTSAPGASMRRRRSPPRTRARRTFRTTGRRALRRLDRSSRASTGGMRMASAPLWQTAPPPAQTQQTRPSTGSLLHPRLGADKTILSCATAFGETEGQGCFAPYACDYAQGVCGCRPCARDAGQFGGNWRCRAWSDVGLGCPTPRPLLGSACNLRDGTGCDYGGCCKGPSLGPSMVCSGGIWQRLAGSGCSCVFPTCP